MYFFKMLNSRETKMRLLYSILLVTIVACNTKTSKPKRQFNAVITTEDLTILNLGREEKDHYFTDTSIRSAYDTLCKLIAAQYRTGQLLKNHKAYRFVGADLFNENGVSIIDSVPFDYLEVPLKRYGVPKGFWLE
ncbi:hypothetical protein ACLOAU_08285 [Niabella sp. CJ426]|uniref:hypothetical protein n=1 Tax=Niabella sp. CJ426 TaxID=3393740 RepID=UPI003D036A1E